MLRCCLAAAAILAAAGSLAKAADPASPVGSWRTIDDETHEPRAVVRIFDRGGVLFGVVEKSLMAHPPREFCDQCTDDRKNKPILGMEFIRGLRKDGDRWDGGTILDPEHGKVYHCKMALQPGGQKLEVRGYIGVSLFGRTQTWERVS
jgi:uncharacterized protein (DUF2147 family)